MFFEDDDEIYGIVDDECEVWEIEKILKKRRRRTKMASNLREATEYEYLIKWRGYVDDFPEIEGEDEEDEDEFQLLQNESSEWYTLDELYELGVDGAEDHVKKFEENFKKKKKEKPKSPKPKPDPEKWKGAVEKAQQALSAELEIQAEKVTKKREEERQKMDEILKQQKMWLDARKEEEEEEQEEDNWIEDDLEDDDDSDSDWEWEEFAPVLEEKISYSSSNYGDKKHARNKWQQKEFLLHQDRVIRRRKVKRHYVCNYDPSLLREAVVVVLGHVDAGKTSLLDALRQTRVQLGEAGGITQQIGATHIPINHISNLTKELNNDFKFELKLPGLVFIDTPGHESFSNMRVRGSSLCDIAVLVVDVKHGLQTQTIESIKLLQSGSTKFVVALNKVDKVNGWVPFARNSFRFAHDNQPKEPKEHFAERMKKVQDQFLENGVLAVPYWKARDLNVHVPIIPVSALDGCGIPDLLLFTMLYSQSLLGKKLLKQKKLKCNIMELNEAPGMGVAADVLLVNGELKKGDKIMMCSRYGPTISLIKSLVVAKSLHEMKGQQDRQMLLEAQTDVATGVCGVKIIADGLTNVLAGTSIFLVRPDDDILLLQKKVTEQLTNLDAKLKISGSGIHVQASTLGSLEALLHFLNENGVPVGSYGIGSLTVRDVRTAKKYIPPKAKKVREITNTILAFNVQISQQVFHAAEEAGVEIIHSDVIYQLLEEFKARKRDYLDSLRNSNTVNAPCIASVAPGYIVSAANPLILGLNIVFGTLQVGSQVFLEDGKSLGYVYSMREISSNVATYYGQEGFVYTTQFQFQSSTRSVSQPVFGRDFFEDEIVWTKTSGRLIRERMDPLQHNQIQKIIAKYKAFNGIFDDNDDENDDYDDVDAADFDLFG